MKKSLWLQLFALSLLVTVAVSAIFFAIFTHAAAATMMETRKNIYLFLAHIVETAPYAEGIQRYDDLRAGAPALAGTIWILSEKNVVIATNTNEAPPAAWSEMPKPESIHGMSVLVPRFGHFADLILVRLDAAQPTYLLVKPSGNTPNRRLAQLEVLLFIGGLLSATLAGLAMLVFYLRKTSVEAKAIIASLRANDLSARFAIRRFDEMANLKLDFNAMADEIEQLIKRVQRIEATRRDLLRELSHDLRTPLTSLRTSVETIGAFHAQMSETQKGELFTVIQSELDYFVRLLDDLFFVADIAEPDYKKARETIDLGALVAAEMQTRQLTHAQLQWRFSIAESLDSSLIGDRHLLQRLLRNTLDNAAKYAKSSVETVLSGNTEQLVLTIADDGKGMTRADIEAYGMRRKHRVQTGTEVANLSLGLGSVIIKAIVELHGGKLQIESSALEDKARGENPKIAREEITGTRFIFSFPRSTQ